MKMGDGGAGPRWSGPYTVAELLDPFRTPRPPTAFAVYLVSRRPWTLQPTRECLPLYVGSITGRGPRLRVRLGDLIADLLGFFSERGEGAKGHHSGGRTLHAFCMKDQVHPHTLYIGWRERWQCLRCEENAVYDSLQPELNKKRPPRCHDHDHTRVPEGAGPAAQQRKSSEE